MLSDMICGQAQTRTIQRHAISGMLLVMQLLQGSIQGPPGHPLTKVQFEDCTLACFDVCEHDVSRRRAFATNTAKKLQITTTSAAHRYFNEALSKSHPPKTIHGHYGICTWLRGHMRRLDDRSRRMSRGRRGAQAKVSGVRNIHCSQLETLSFAKFKCNQFRLLPAPTSTASYDCLARTPQRPNTAFNSFPLGRPGCVHCVR